ncbi:SAD/SRA domain-containing protein [Haematococcus lacustris]
MENHPDAQAKARVQEALCAYRTRVAELASAGRPKPDMVAFSELRKKWLPSQQTYGHIPGVAIGDVFQGRGELAIVGLHQNMMTGILTSKDATRGALAVVLSGGYADNDDQGSSVWYTGSGGQKAGHQVQDQVWKGANQALRQAHLSKAPVRLIRPSASPVLKGPLCAGSGWRACRASTSLVSRSSTRCAP